MYNAMSVRKNIRISERENCLLKLYCEQEECSETEAVRSLLRGLEKKLTHENKQLLANMSKVDTVS
jgi:hypothetical protein